MFFSRLIFDATDGKSVIEPPIIIGSIKIVDIRSLHIFVRCRMHIHIVYFIAIALGITTTISSRTPKECIVPLTIEISGFVSTASW